DRDRSGRALERPRALGRGRGGLHRRPRREPPGIELAARGAGVRRSRGARTRRAARTAAARGVAGSVRVATRSRRRRGMRGAATIAHNYQRPEIQDLADVVADSLTMARRAIAIDASVIVICGVHFMAETAAIANPDKRVLIPDPGAGCSLAATIQAADVRAWRAAHPDGVVVAYVNTSAAVKAEVDYCCTSGNAVAVIQALPAGV